MALPTGVTRIPRRSVTYIEQDSFQLAGRLGNASAGDLVNPGNMWRQDIGTAQRQTRLLDTVLDAGNLMAVVLGNDCRNWIRVTDNVSLGNAYGSGRPNSVYWSALSGNIDVIIQNTNFKVGDRLTYVNVGTGKVDFYLSGLVGVTFSGPIISRIVMKASNPGTSITLELNYLNPTTGTLCWHLVNTNGAIGDLGDPAYPIVVT